MMEEIKGYKLDKFPQENLTKMRDLVYFDGPLLSYFKSRSGDNYLYYWCDVDENYNRWLIFRVSDQSLNRYLNGELSLLDLMKNPSDGFFYSVDIDNDLEYHNILRVLPKDLPASYLPEQDSYFDASLSDNELTPSMIESPEEELPVIADIYHGRIFIIESGFDVDIQPVYFDDDEGYQRLGDIFAKRVTKPNRSIKLDFVHWAFAHSSS